MRLKVAGGGSNTGACSERYQQAFQLNIGKNIYNSLIYNNKTLKNLASRAAPFLEVWKTAIE
jgi:hypothetical protein